MWFLSSDVTEINYDQIMKIAIGIVQVLRS